MYDYIPFFERNEGRIADFLNIVSDPDLNVTQKEIIRHAFRMTTLLYRELRFNATLEKLHKAQDRYEAEIEVMNLRKKMFDL